jgi:L-methionine (R)-S-oxide reductase
MMQTDPQFWQRLIQQAEGLLSVSSNRITNAANLSALLFQEIGDISWAGFYLLHGDKLLLGPFQGKPACVSIDMGKGVCGVAAESGKTIRVADVDKFDGHIACDAASRSEIVVPLFKDEKLLGVLDIDSTRYDRFSVEDETGLNELAQVFLDSIE